MDFWFEKWHFQAVQTDDPVNSCIDLYKSPHLNGKTLITPHVTGVFVDDHWGDKLRATKRRLCNFDVLNL